VIRFDDRTAIVTGAGAGLGRAHALGLAARGARVLVNDLSQDAADAVAAEIAEAGGQAVALAADIAAPQAGPELVQAALDRWGRIDILVNNAGILRDKSFGKMQMDDFRKVLDVHLIGATQLTRAAWPHMRAAGYGRVVFTSSGSGLYGNFGQANYGAAKAALLGLMNVLAIEGARDGIRVNLLAPTAVTAMTSDLMPAEAHALLAPETITPGLLWLVSQDAPTKTILSAGAGHFATTQITETEGITLTGDDLTPEAVAARAGEITDPQGAHTIADAFTQTRRFARNAAAKRGLTLDW
jgi:NAD(P)-dependent dehydrogenase (short-subunit alcohol dehydrogenase family)